MCADGWPDGRNGLPGAKVCLYQNNVIYLQKVLYKMETVTRTQTAFRLKDSLLDVLKRNARKAGKSLNAYVEEALEATAEKDFAYPQLPEDFFRANRSFSESFALKGVRLPKGYKGQDPFAQVELDHQLIMEAKYEENL